MDESNVLLTAVNFVKIVGKLERKNVRQSVAFLTVKVLEPKGNRTYTSYIDVTCFGELVDSASRLDEGASVTVYGRLAKTKDDTTGYWKLQLIANRMCSVERPEDEEDVQF